MGQFSGTFGDKYIPVGYSSYNIYSNENNGGSTVLRLWSPAQNAQTGPITISAQFNSNTATIKSFTGTSITSLASEEWITLVYDQGNTNRWKVISRGIRGVSTSTLLSTGSFNSYTGSTTSQFAGTASFASTASYALSGPYKVYTAILAWEVGGITATVLQNNTGATISWADTGEAEGTADNAVFTSGKTWVMPSSWQAGGEYFGLNGFRISDTLVRLYPIRPSDNTSTVSYTTYIPVEIRIYP